MTRPQSCKRLRAALHAMVPFWLQQCQKQGWRVTDEYAQQTNNQMVARHSEIMSSALWYFTPVDQQFYN